MSHYICGVCGTDTCSAAETIQRSEECTNDACPLKKEDAFVIEDARSHAAPNGEKK